MFQITHMLNERLADSPLWAQLAENVEDAINRIVGDATMEALRAGGATRYLRGDTVDPRTFPDLLAVDTDSDPYAQLVIDRVGQAKVKVVLPQGDPSTVILYMEIDGQLYYTSTNRFVDRKILIKEAQYLGFDFFSDTLSDADYARVVNFVSEYWKASGSYEAFAGFLGFVRDIRIEVSQLWTQDDGTDAYNELVPFDGANTPVWEYGPWYPTSHVNINYDIFGEDENTDELARLFYLLAPIHLVLSRMVATAWADADVTSICAASVTVYEHSNIWLEPKPEAIRQMYGRIVTANAPELLLAANPNRINLTIQNTGPAALNIYDGDPAFTGVTHVINVGTSYVYPAGVAYKGDVYISCAVDTGTFHVTEG